MDFRERLEKKITVDELAIRVAASLRDPNSGITFDSRAMRQLLDMGPYRHVRERDTDLFIREGDSDTEATILVLDNGLPIYHTTLEDVLMRKSPTVKEMISFTNAYKILNDSDVLVSRKVDSVKTVRQVVLADMDLGYDTRDIHNLTDAGRQALERHAGEEVVLILRLFAELLGYEKVPKAFRFGVSATTVMGRVDEKTVGEYEARTIVIYDAANNRLLLVDGPLNTFDKARMENYQRILSGHQSAATRGLAVFDRLQEQVLAEKPAVPTQLKGLR